MLNGKSAFVMPLQSTAVDMGGGVICTLRFFNSLRVLISYDAL